MTPPRKWMSTLRSLSSSSDKITRRLNMIICIKSLHRNGSPSGKERQSGRPVDVTYCILDHGKQDHSVRPLRNWMLYSQTSQCKLALLLKKAGVTLVEKLRTIVLFQGDFNYLNKYIGCHIRLVRSFHVFLGFD
jgi:hypothetical protein